MERRIELRVFFLSFRESQKFKISIIAEWRGAAGNNFKPSVWVGVLWKWIAQIKFIPNDILVFMNVSCVESSWLLFPRAGIAPCHAGLVYPLRGSSSTYIRVTRTKHGFGELIENVLLFIKTFSLV